MRHDFYLSATEAAEVVGMTTTTITSAIKKNKFSAEKDSSGYHIDPAALKSAYPKKFNMDRLEAIQNRRNGQKSTPKNDNSQTAHKIELLEQEIRHLKEQLEGQIRQTSTEKERRIEEQELYKANIETLKDQVSTLKLLTYDPERDENQEKATKKKGFLGRMFG